MGGYYEDAYDYPGPISAGVDTVSAEDFAERYGMSVEAARSTLAAYAADPTDEQWATISQDDLDRGAMQDLAGGAETLIIAPQLVTPMVYERIPQLEVMGSKEVEKELGLEGVSKAEIQAMYGLGLIQEDALFMPGELISIILAVLGFLGVSVSGTALAVLTPVIGFLGGNIGWAALVVALGAVVTALLTTGDQLIDAPKAVYVGNRLAGVIDGKINDRSAQGFGRNRMTAYEMRSGGDRAPIRRY